MTVIGESYDFLLKLVVIGDSGVGKTNLLSRFDKNEFSSQFRPTIGVEFATKTILIDERKIKTQIWDTAGQERFRAITQAYYKGASGALIVFDITRRNSYDNLAKWLDQLKSNTEEQMVKILIGNKCDLVQERAVKIEEAVQFAYDKKLFYLETSALEGTNVDEAFMNVIKEIYDHKFKGAKKELNTIQKSNHKIEKIKKIILTKQKTPKRKKCCE